MKKTIIIVLIILALCLVYLLAASQTYEKFNIKKTLRSPRTKVRGLSGFLDAQRAPRPKGRGFSKHVDIIKSST